MKTNMVRWGTWLCAMWVGLAVAAQPGAPMQPVLPDTVKMATLLLPPADVFDGGPAMRGPLFLATQAATALAPAELRRPGTADLGDVLEGLPGVDEIGRAHV